MSLEAHIPTPEPPQPDSDKPPGPPRPLPPGEVPPKPSDTPPPVNDPPMPGERPVRDPPPDQTPNPPRYGGQVTSAIEL